MASSPLLPVALRNSLQEIVYRSNLAAAGIQVILFSTTEGVPLGRVYAENSHPFDEEVLASLESVWAPPCKTQALLGLEKLKQVTAIYDHGVLMHVYQAPLVITILCTAQSNLGAVRSAIPHLSKVLSPLCITLVNSLKFPDGEYHHPPGSAYYH